MVIIIIILYSPASVQLPLPVSLPAKMTGGVADVNMCDVAMQVDGSEAGVTSADGRYDGLATANEHETAASDDRIGRDVGGVGDCQSTCDWSQPSADDAADAYHAVKFFGEESLQGIDADDECGDSSSSSEDDWQEVEGICSAH